jgi:hypothetical protein
MLRLTLWAPVSCQTELSRLFLHVNLPGATLVPRSIALE